MSGQQNVFGFVDAGREKRRTSDIGMQALHKAAVGLADVGRARPSFKTKDLVRLLLAHAARTRRASLPVARSRVHVLSPDGKFAVEIRF